MTVPLSVSRCCRHSACREGTLQAERPRGIRVPAPGLAPLAGDCPAGKRPQGCCSHWCCGVPAIDRRSTICGCTLTVREETHMNPNAYCIISETTEDRFD